MVQNTEVAYVIVKPMDNDTSSYGLLNPPDSGNVTNSTSGSDVQREYWASLLGLFVIVTLFGNILVVVTVKKVPTLQSVTNYLIVSLAIADITVGTLVMPLAVYVAVSHPPQLLFLSFVRYYRP